MAGHTKMLQVKFHLEEVLPKVLQKQNLSTQNVPLKNYSVLLFEPSKQFHLTQLQNLNLSG